MSASRNWPGGDTLAFLLGRWQLERQLFDHRSGATGWFTGEAEYAPAPGGPAPGGPAPGAEVRYTERGELRLGGHAGPAGRALRCLRRADGSADVRFTDGRAFYHLDLRSGCWKSRHGCGRDDYAVTVRVLGADLVAEHWTVTGPAKDYETSTTLRRITAPAPGP